MTSLTVSVDGTEHAIAGVAWHRLPLVASQHHAVVEEWLTGDCVPGGERHGAVGDVRRPHATNVLYANVRVGVATKSTVM